MTGYCPECGNTLCICDQISKDSPSQDELARLRSIRQKTEGVNIYALETGDLLFLIENLEKEWGEG